MNTITVNNLRNMLQLGERAQYIDLRDSAQFHNEHVDGFTNVPITELDSYENVLDKASKVILLCTNGKRAYEAFDKLSKWGFADVLIVAGGLLAWKVQVYPLSRA